MAIYYGARQADLTLAVTTGASLMLAGLITEALRVDEVQSIRYSAEDAYREWRNRTGTLLPRAGYLMSLRRMRPARQQHVCYPRRRWHYLAEHYFCLA